MRRVTILGGGVYTPRLCALLADALQGPLRIVLHGRRLERVDVLAQAARVRSAAPAVEICATTDRERALDGADAVVLLVRVGGFAARAHDERFPQAFGLVGDEGLGVGGLANGWRTVPYLAELVADVRRRCPTAFVANLMAPLGMTTAVLHDAGLDTLGICELPAVTRATLGHGPGEGRYGGLNHLAWFWDLPRRPGVHPLKYQARVFGGAPPPLGRAEALAELDTAIFEALRGQPGALPSAEQARPTPWFEHALVPMLAARLGSAGTYEGFANVPNANLVPGLPPEQIVEVEVSLTGLRLATRASGPLPPEVRPLLDAVARAERLGLAAARVRSLAGLRVAIGALPHTLTQAHIGALAELAAAPVGVET